jgi:hypothetical protein
MEMFEALEFSSDGQLYAGGTVFEEPGGGYVSHWNGSYWSQTHFGFGGDYVNALASDQAGNLYAG